MAAAFELDLSEVERLAVGIGRASTAAIKAVRPVVAKAALNVKNDARSRVSSHPSWGQLAATLNYEQVGLSAEIGYDDVGQGNLAGIAEFGSARHAPHPALMPAFKAEAPKFERYLGEAVARAAESAL